MNIVNSRPTPNQIQAQREARAARAERLEAKRTERLESERVRFVKRLVIWIVLVVIVWITACTITAIMLSPLNVVIGTILLISLVCTMLLGWAMSAEEHLHTTRVNRLDHRISR